MPEVRPATIDDVPELCGLLGELFSLEAEFEPDTAKQETALREIITHPETGRILVLHDNGAVIGMVSLLFTISTACGGKAILLEDMVIKSSHRSKGTGSILLGHAMAFARSNGYTRITLLTDSDAAAIRFYERHGFSLSSMVPMRLHL